MTKEQITAARLERNPQPWEIDDFILAMCERTQQEKTDSDSLTKVIADLTLAETRLEDSRRFVDDLQRQTAHLKEQIEDLKAQNIELLTKDVDPQDIKAVEEVVKVDPNVIKRPRAAKKSSRKK